MTELAAVLEKPVGRAEFGRCVGISVQRVGDLARDGVLQAGDSFGDWLLAYCAHIREHAGARKPTGAKTRLENARAARAEFELARERQQYLLIDDVLEAWSSAYVAQRAVLLRFPSELALAFAAAPVEKRAMVEATARDVVYRVLDALAECPQTKSQPKQPARRKPRKTRGKR